MAKVNSKSLSIPFSFMVNLELIKNGDKFLFIIRDFGSRVPLQVCDDVKDIAPCVLRLAEQFQAIHTESASAGRK